MWVLNFIDILISFEHLDRYCAIPRQKDNPNKSLGLLQTYASISSDWVKDTQTIEFVEYPVSKNSISFFLSFLSTAVTYNTIYRMFRLGEFEENLDVTEILLTKKTVDGIWITHLSCYYVLMMNINFLTYLKQLDYFENTR